MEIREIENSIFVQHGLFFKKNIGDVRFTNLKVFDVF